MEHRRAAGRATWARRVTIVLGVIVCLYLVGVIWDYEALMQWVARARALPFFVAMALLPAIGVPFTPLFLLAGASFGVKLGLIGTTIALAANLALCYWIGRGGLRRHLVSLLRRFGYKLPDFELAEAERSRRDAVRFTAVIKVAPGVPGFVKNYGLGAARVPFWIFFAISMAISGAYAAVLIVVGESLFEHEIDRGVIALLVAAVLAFALWRWSRRSTGTVVADA